MTAGLPSPRWLDAIKREWKLYHLGLPEFRYMFEPPPDNEWVSLDCETTGLNVRTDEIVSIGAVRIVGNRIMTSERLELPAISFGLNSGFIVAPSAVQPDISARVSTQSGTCKGPRTGESAA